MKRCPTCGREVIRLRRICGACHLPIRKGHKFYFDGSTVKHWVCDAPKERDRRDLDENPTPQQESLEVIA